MLQIFHINLVLYLFFCLLSVVYQWRKPGAAFGQQQTPELAHQGEISL